MDFKAHETVKQKSGGPEMSVVKVEEDRVLCRWFERMTPKEEWFYKADLEYPLLMMPFVGA